MHPHDGRVVSNFIVQALNNEPITIFGDGGQTRSFCYVEDLIQGLVALMETADGVTGPMNLGNPTEFTILQLAERVSRLRGQSRNSFTANCRPMIRRRAVPTLHSQNPQSVGLLASSSRKGSSGRSSTSKSG